MAQDDPLTTELDLLIQAVERAVGTLQRLGEENRGLRHSQQQLNGERASLLARNEEARGRVEAMIQRLKSLENNG